MNRKVVMVLLFLSGFVFCEMCILFIPSFGILSPNKVLYIASKKELLTIAEGFVKAKDDPLCINTLATVHYEGVIKSISFDQQDNSLSFFLKNQGVNKPITTDMATLTIENIKGAKISFKELKVGDLIALYTSFSFKKPGFSSKIIKL